MVPRIRTYSYFDGLSLFTLRSGSMQVATLMYAIPLVISNEGANEVRRLLDTAHMAILCIAAYFTLLGYNNPSAMQNMLTWYVAVKTFKVHN